MGNRLHARTLNRIEYSDGGYNWNPYRLSLLLSSFSDSFWINEEETECSLPKVDFKKGIENLKKLTEKQFNKEHPSILVDGLSLQNLIADLEGLLDSADPEHDEIYMDWF